MKRFKTHQEMLELLALLARDIKPVANARLFAAICIRNKIISVGCNKDKTHPLQLKFGKNPFSIFLHAELDAIKNSLKRINVLDLKKSTLFICRIKMDNSWGLAKPCKGCQEAMSFFRIPHVTYSTGIDRNMCKIDFK